ncbi:ABC transporter permease [Martelella endophytica]|uniref:ABC transporter permease n=1 Tax=Martelella endophytica TaxID=1486262 RepID=A0A0D5LUV3_MAREN|nr:ABC transporter permease [Martelella endophytica]AJY47542.1 ABC transporter permease [Martelella endophytica]
MSDNSRLDDLAELETPPPLPRLSALLRPHRLVIIAVAVALLVLMAVKMRWDWLPEYAGMLVTGLWVTVLLLIASTVLGLLMAIPLGLAQASGPVYLAWPARVFCTIIRGTPLLLQLWLLYYGLGSLFPGIPGIRQSFIWPYLREAWPYGLLALTLSYAGYEGEVMRGAFAGVPNGELEAAKAYGMGRFTMLRRIWLPRALHRALPTLAGETVVQLKSTPLVATITVVDLYSVVGDIRQSTYLTYEPLLFLAFLYLCLTGILVSIFRYYEKKIPTRGR